MKKIVVMSDNHGDMDAMERVKELEPDGDIYVHCGDSMAFDEDYLSGFICVEGNSDWGFFDLPLSVELEVEDRRILVNHGQRYGYFNREEHMIAHMDQCDCTILFSGHTHVPHMIHIDDYYMINPGSTNRPRSDDGPTYAVVMINGHDVDVEIKPFFYDM